MSVHFISGKPGGGKSLYSMSILRDELLNGTRLIVTNLPVNIGRLNEWLQENYPTKNINLHERLRVLNDETETGQFWLYRWPSQQIGAISAEQWAKGERYNFGKPVLDVGEVDRGVLFVIDELHLFFNAREWMNTGKGCLFYLSQHRKLGDDVVCITQSIGNVDKQFRSVAQDFTYVRNLRKEKRGVFKLPGLFVRTTYLEPHNGAPGQESCETRTFSLDVNGLASCYDTARGVSVIGRTGADAGREARGIPWQVGIIVLLLLIAGAAMVPKMLGKAANSLAHQTTALVTNAPAALKPAVTNGPVPAVKPASSGHPGQVAPSETPRIVGRFVRGEVATVWLDTGEHLTVPAYMLTPRGVMVRGVEYQWAKPATATPEQVTPRNATLEQVQPDAVQPYKPANLLNVTIGGQTFTRSLVK